MITSPKYRAVMFGPDLKWGAIASQNWQFSQAYQLLAVDLLGDLPT